MRRGRRFYLWLIPLAALLLGFSASWAFAQGLDPTDDEVNAVARQLYCPVCENVPLDACGTVACEQWRGIIRDKLAQGWTEEQIKDYFVAQYGDRVLAEPPPRGFNWLVYIVPLLAFAGGSFALYQGFKHWKSPAEGKPPGGKTPRPAAGDPVMDEYMDKVEEALRERTGEGS
jgi:cytochrome c-type biogenesis protein CcmH